MKVTEGFLAYVLDQLAQWEGVYTKKMFGGVGLFYEGLMFGLVYNDSVALKVDLRNQSKYIAAGEAPITVFKTNTPLPSYYTVPGSVFENASDFVSWAKESYQIQVQKL
ncbi:TfoX/Sxy family protein [Zobellia galactanivorans]|uniref:TfoX/Sxy family protein n=1 Tax=Zobellia galactanivorans (strain DSM 12802 / CCUG 47099 / CIP 106680 / NCIMB 13871 / Dsij) TaxID=63186 RepID=UPI001C078B3B|nr:TfoX/Sxy family protein [Zobellia galactanivorans]MBU3024920.1 TfoX/Sxy family protein [Zobellia galactanivorans]